MLADVSYVIVDEVHELAGSKRGAQLAIGLERLFEIAGEFQRVGLSATVGSPEEVAKFLVGTNRSAEIVEVPIAKSLNFEVISPAPRRQDFKDAKKLVTSPEMVAHLRYIDTIVQQKKSTLIFVNTRQSAEALGSRFHLLGADIGVHHSSLSKETRIDAEDAFKRGDIKALICTSSMELGIDIGDIEHVIQYASPRQVTRLLQRVGRSGHKLNEASRGTIVAIHPDDIAESWAITRRAYDGEIEPIELHAAGDALANQICGIALDFGKIEIDALHKIVCRAYPFRDTTRAQLLEIIHQLSEQRLLWLEGNTIGRKRRTWQYFYENLSMIPDEKRYDIYDVIRRRTVGSLDEAFVVNFASPGKTFIAKGDMWRILELSEGEIKVEPVETPSGEIPSWAGEEIPVPYEVAQEVGHIRAKIANMLDKSDEAMVRELRKSYPTDACSAKKVIELIRAQVQGGFPLPTDERIVIEGDGTLVIINACFGHKVNETLGRIIASLLTARFGSSVAMQVDPYRIKLKLPKQLPLAEIRDLVLSVKPEYIGPIIEMTLKNTSLLKWKMIHVARKFGALSHDLDYSRVSMDKLLSIFYGTPMYEEAVREIFHDKLDVRRTEETLKRVRSGEIKLATSNLSPIGLAGPTSGAELIAPERADRSILLALKERILNDRVILFCVNCKRWQSRRKVRRVPETPQCPLCESRMIAALKPWEEEEIKLTQRAGRLESRDDKVRVRRVFKNANLVLSHGKTAVIALASRGLGPEMASRIIQRQREDETSFYKDILKAERSYMRTRRFWD